VQERIGWGAIARRRHSRSMCPRDAPALLRSCAAAPVMADRKSFLLRIDHEVLDAVQRWANDDLRSLNGQIEFLLRKILKEEGRLTADRSATRRRAEDD
jgi:hypothetical protein